MNIILCIDNKNGVMFNNRRQSRDRILCEKVVSLLGGGRLFLNSYSYTLFEDFDINVRVYEDCLKVAQKGDFCFVEGKELTGHIPNIEKLIVFKWNRDYPSDKKLDINLSSGWVVAETEDFEGSSHEKITMEVYVKE